jgi:uncharacterized protein YggT (Ycf19 family)
MAIKRTVIEEVPETDDPTVVRKTKTIVNPDIHTPIVDAKEEVVDSPDSTEVRQTKIVHEPLVTAEHPQHVYETKKAIFKSWQIIWYILAVIEVLLGLRMTFKAIGANEFSGFVSLVYSITDILVAPFAAIIPPTINGNSVIEWSTIIAAIIYALIAWGLVSLVHMARPVTPEEVEHAV